MYVIGKKKCQYFFCHCFLLQPNLKLLNNRQRLFFSWWDWSLMRRDHKPRDIHWLSLNWYGFSPTTKGKKGQRLLTRPHRMSHFWHYGRVTPLPSPNNRISSPARSDTAVKAPISSWHLQAEEKQTAVPFNGENSISSVLLVTLSHDRHLWNNIEDTRK